jgi:glycine cleavage system H lipoate-binding protein
MMHSKDRQEYRRALEEAMLSVSSDEELEVLKNFDYNSDRFCYSQTDASFVGIGISDSMNEKYHDLIKAQLPYETKYIKAVNTIMDLI